MDLTREIFNHSWLKNEQALLLVFIIISLLLAAIIMLSSYIIARQNPESEKLSSYECGFEPYEDTRNSFDIKFCVVAILFIIFDIEIMFLIPWCVSISKLNLLGFWSMMDFLLELGIGFFYIWSVKALDWN